MQTIIKKDFFMLLVRLERAIININEIRSKDVSRFVKGYGWEKMAPRYDDMLNELAAD